MSAVSWCFDVTLDLISDLRLKFLTLKLTNANTKTNKGLKPLHWFREYFLLTFLLRIVLYFIVSFVYAALRLLAVSLLRSSASTLCFTIDLACFIKISVYNLNFTNYNCSFSLFLFLFSFVFCCLLLFSIFNKHCIFCVQFCSFCKV